LQEHIPRSLVSICIPTYNGSRWLGECIDSALSQSYPDLEILIVDDASTDDTITIARSFKDHRIRIVANEKNRGLVANWNESVRLAKGEFIKFLFQDDVLRPACVERMMELFSTHPRLGLVFSPRETIIEPDVGAEAARRWLAYGESLHQSFDVSPGLNDGPKLFEQHLAKRFLSCCIGEPTTVLIKQECFQRLGLFNPRLHQICDIEMWLRIMCFYDIGFIDEKLSAFRFHAGSATSANDRTRKHTFDMLWLLEGLLSHDRIRMNHPAVEELRNYQLAHNSLLRPSAGWRSLRTSEGRRLALDDVALLPRRTLLLATYYAYRLRKIIGSSRN
jgi:glycosyltransferase involved in cell wall biosynthesis